LRIQGCSVNDGGRRLGGRRWRGDSRASHLLAVEGDGMMGPYASCDHEVGEEAGVGGAHEAGNEASVGGDDQQI
jgi:hypothetical protein